MLGRSKTAPLHTALRWSVILALDEVGVADLEEAVEPAIGDRDVVFKAFPRAVGLPPVPAAAPRAADLGDVTRETMREDIRGPAFALGKFEVRQ